MKSTTISDVTLFTTILQIRLGQLVVSTVGAFGFLGRYDAWQMGHEMNKDIGRSI